MTKQSVLAGCEIASGVRPRNCKQWGQVLHLEMCQDTRPDPIMRDSMITI